MELSQHMSAGIIASRHDIRILQSLRRITHALEIHSRKLKAQFGITSPQLVCLLTVNEEEPLTATAIARRVFLTPSTVVGIIDRLEEKGLVRRQRDTHDRRLVYVTVTGDGRRVARKAPSPLQDSLAEALADLPELEQVAIALSLERITELMECARSDGGPQLIVDTHQESESPTHS